MASDKMIPYFRAQLHKQAVHMIHIWRDSGAGQHFDMECEEWKDLVPAHRVTKESARRLLDLIAQVNDWIETAELEDNPRYHPMLVQRVALKVARSDHSFQRVVSLITKDGGSKPKRSKNRADELHKLRSLSSAYDPDNTSPEEGARARKAMSALLKKYLEK